MSLDTLGNEGAEDAALPRSFRQGSYHRCALRLSLMHATAD